MWPWSGYLLPQCPLHSDGWVTVAKMEDKQHTAEVQTSSFYAVCQKKRSHFSSYCVLVLAAPGGILIQTLIQSQNNRGEIPSQVQYVCCLRSKPTQSNTNLVFPPDHSPPLLFSFKRAKSIRKAVSLCCHLRGCCTSISFPPTLTRFGVGQFPLLSISLHLFGQVLKTSPAQTISWRITSAFYFYMGTPGSLLHKGTQNKIQ